MREKPPPNKQQHNAYRPKRPALSYLQVKQERDKLALEQEWLDARMIAATAIGNRIITCNAPGQSPRPDRYFAGSRNRWIKYEEAVARVEDCKAGVIFDAESGTNRRLNHDEQRQHLLDGILPVIRVYLVTEPPNLPVQPPASDCPTEVI